MNKTVGGSAGAPMSPLPSDNADSTLHAAGSVSLAPVFTPHGRLTLSPAVEAPLLEAATAGRLQLAFTRGSGYGPLQLGAGESGPERGLRPVFHQIDRRVERHLFISVLAYHFVHTLRLQLKGQGIDDSWQTLRETLATQRRVTATLQRRDGRTVHVRKATRPEPHHQTINQILGHSPNPGGTHRVLV